MLFPLSIGSGFGCSLAHHRHTPLWANIRLLQAKKYVPAELPLVNLFGWTLGGFYIARYTDSPVGKFDELVALAGLVWNAPTSCAWAARVYVNNKEARDHGIGAVGLPSRFANFKAVPLPALGAAAMGHDGTTARASKRGEAAVSSSSTRCSWWDAFERNGGSEVTTSNSQPTVTLELSNVDRRGRGFLQRLGLHRRNSGKERGLSSPVCSIQMPGTPRGWGPKIQMFLPSFSGATPDHPELLKYSLRLFTRVRFLKPVKLRFPETRSDEERTSSEVMDGVLGGRPLLCMAFDNMEMEVEPPQVWAPSRETCSAGAVA
jgi:hypothetical protein